MSSNDQLILTQTLLGYAVVAIFGFLFIGWIQRRRREANPSAEEVNPNGPFVCLVVGTGMCFFSPLLGGILILTSFASAAFGPKTRRALTTHGSARFATWHDAKHGGLLAEQGVLLGRADRLKGRPKQQGTPNLLRMADFVHLATFAPTGRGKGVSVVIPNLLSYAGSVVVTDPKGENFNLTSAYRLRRFGQRIIRLDPHNQCGGGGDTFNPLDFIQDRADDFLDQVRDLANLLVFRKGTEHEPHWNDSAQLVITAIIAFVCACSSKRMDRTLQTVCMILSSPDNFRQAIKLMKEVRSHQGVIARLGQKISWLEGDELSSVLSTVQRHLDFLSSPAVARFTATTSFDPECLRSPQGASLYIVLRTDRIKSMPGLARMLVGTLLRVVSGESPSEKDPTLFILDEVGQFGRMEILEEAATYMRGYGVRLWFIFQSLNQVYEAYGEHAGTLLDNIDTHQHFGTNRIETAEIVSKRMGDSTILVESESESVSYSQQMQAAFAPAQPGSRSISRNSSVSPHGRRLMMPEEILRLPPGMAIVLHRHLPPLLVPLLRYFDAPEFREYRAFQAGQALPPHRPHAIGPKAKKVDFYVRAACFLVAFGSFGLAGYAYLEQNGHLPRWSQPAVSSVASADVSRPAPPKAMAIPKAEPVQPFGIPDPRPPRLPQPHARPLTEPEQLAIRQQAAPRPAARLASHSPAPNVRHLAANADTGRFPTTITPRERIYPLPPPPPPPFRLGGSGYSPQ